MELNLDRVNIDSVAQLIGRQPQKLRDQLAKVGLTIPDDGIVDFELLSLALLERNEDWSAIIGPIKFVSPGAPADGSLAAPRLCADLGAFELQSTTECLETPSDPEEIRRLLVFLDTNAEYVLAAEVAAAAHKALVAGIVPGDRRFESECRMHYAVSRTKALLGSGRYRFAGEMAFAALACAAELGPIERNDGLVRLYLSAGLASEGVVGKSAWQEYTVEEMILMGFEAEQAKTADTLREALLRALFVSENLSERLGLSRDARIVLRKNLDVLAGEFGIETDSQGIDFYDGLAGRISQDVRSLRGIVEACLSSGGFTGILQYRSRLIPNVKELRRFATSCELEAIDGVTELLGPRLTELKRQRDSGSIRDYGLAHAQFLEMTSNLESQIEAGPSWLSSCFMLPVLDWLKRCLVTDFHERTSVYATEVGVYLSKKEYPVKAGASQSLTVLLKNEGNSDAERVAVRFRSTPDVELVESQLEIGDLAVGGVNGEVSIDAQVVSERAAYEIPYTVSWGNVTGERKTNSRSLKLLPQRPIEWEKHQTNPYTIASIKEDQAERLKGRTDVLTALRMGLDSMQSFFITGQKRVGKSSIANVYYGVLFSHANVLPVRFLWGDVADCDLPTLGEAMCQFVSEAWQDKTKSGLPFAVPSIDSFRISFSRTLSEFLRSFNRQFPTWKIVFIIDDFDEIREDLYKGETGDVFFTTLRAFIDRNFTSFIMVGSETLQTTILREQGRKVNQADTLEVDYLDNRRDLEEVITEPAQEVLFFDQDAVSEIITLTAGNPYYANLLCSRIYRLMYDERDYYVSRGDVKKAAELLTREDKEKSYNHFWTDGIRDVGPEKDRISYNNAMTLVAISKSEADASRYTDTRTIYQQSEVHHLETSELEFRLNELADRKVIERHPSSANRFRIKVGVFDLWLKSGGAHQIRQSFGQYEYTIKPMKDYALFPEEIVQVAEGLVYRGEDIDRILVETWLRQFGDEYQQRLAYKVLCALRERGYHSTAKFNHALETMLKKAVAATSDWAKTIEKNLARNVLVCHIDPIGKSGPALVTEFRRVNQIYSKLCGTVEEIADILAGKSEFSKQVKPGHRWLLMIVDDFVGTGNAASEYIIRALETLDGLAPGWDSRCHPFYAFACGFEKGAEIVESASEYRVKVLVANPLDEKDRAFSPDVGIFQDERERTNAKALFQKIGSSLEKKHPLGHEGSEALIVFPNNVPNNTLPVFYKQGRYEGKLWTPLFPRV